MKADQRSHYIILINSTVPRLLGSTIFVSYGLARISKSFQSNLNLLLVAFNAFTWNPNFSERIIKMKALGVTMFISFFD